MHHESISLPTNKFFLKTSHHKMNSSTLCSLALCSILISHSLLLANAIAHGHREPRGNSPDLISQICKETLQDQSNCTDILREDPKIVQAKNFFEFSKAVLELALRKGINGQNFFKGLAQKIGAPALVECANSDYNDVVGSFGSALDELKEDHLSANYDAKVAGDGSKNCERALAIAHIVNPTISTLNYQISLLSDIAYLATNRLLI